MVDKLSPVKPVQRATEQHRNFPSKDEKETRDKIFTGEDRVTVEHETAATTYGKLAGVEVGSSYQLLRQLVVKTLNDQGVTSLISTGEGEIDLGTLTPEAAGDLVSEDGYFGVDKTSQRIVDFAINAFGNDPAKLAQMKDAIEKGFQEAAEVFGGMLPEISHQTYAAVMDKLDTFAGTTDEERGENHG